MILFLKIILYAAQGTALAAAIYKWNENKNTNQKYFLHLMVVVASVEIIANILRLYAGINNNILYNPFIVFSFIFYFYWYYKILKQKKVVLILSSIFIVLVPISMYFEDFRYTFLDISTYFGSMCVIIFSFMYLTQLLRLNEIINFSKSQPFWISSGLLIFYIGFIPLLFVQNNYSPNRIPFQLVITVLNVTLYGCFAKAFLCPLKK